MDYNQFRGWCSWMPAFRSMHHNTLEHFYSPKTHIKRLAGILEPVCIWSRLCLCARAWWRLMLALMVRWIGTQTALHQDFEGRPRWDGLVKLVHANRVGELVYSPRKHQSFIWLLLIRQGTIDLTAAIWEPSLKTGLFRRFCQILECLSNSVCVRQNGSLRDVRRTILEPD